MELRVAAVACMQKEVRVKKKTEFLAPTSLLFMNRKEMRLARMVTPPMRKKVMASDWSTPKVMENPTVLRLS